ncbi:putative EF-hand domain pair protein [Rosa chinensis]|uniref:Putative EF-hand domain pair protein n=1 Tax=Rosa chinensis TaxID=74649 RepID=A0A2P6PZX7_ROSCH|nr:putative EF-hand domain pair protein [Rosa chinensis]
MKLEEMYTVMSEFDKDSDGHIDLEEFSEIMNGSVWSKDLRDTFDLYNLDKKCLISASELHELLKLLGQKCSVGECATMITKFDFNGDGFVKTVFEILIYQFHQNPFQLAFHIFHRDLGLGFEFVIRPTL